MSDLHASRELFTIEQFVTLSAKINYQLSSHSLKKSVLLSLVLVITTHEFVNSITCNNFFRVLFHIIVK